MKKVCCVCGKKDCAGGRLIQDNYRLCEICASNYIATVAGATVSDEFFLSHGPDLFKDALVECRNPYRNISFNFKTKKIYLKDAMRKKNYKVVSFSDLIGFRADVKADMGYNAGLSNRERFRALDADFRYNGTTVRYHIDDSLSETKGQVFDQIVDCFTRVQNSGTRFESRQATSVSNAQNSPIHHAQAQQFSACGSAQSPTSPYQFRCPYCGGTNCTPVVETSTTGKDFSTGKACCGSLFFWNPAGLLCGFCGKGKQTTSTIELILPMDEQPTETHRKNITRIREDMKLRYFEAPDLRHVGKNAYRFLNAVSDFATHAKPLRETASYRENLFAKTIEGNPLIDKAYELVMAA